MLKHKETSNKSVVKIVFLVDAVFLFLLLGSVRKSDSTRRDFLSVERIHTVLFPSWTPHCPYVHLPWTTSKAGKKPLWRIYQSVKHSQLSLVKKTLESLFKWSQTVKEDGKMAMSDILSNRGFLLQNWSRGKSRQQIVVVVLDNLVLMYDKMHAEILIITWNN